MVPFLSVCRSVIESVSTRIRPSGNQAVAILTGLALANDWEPVGWCLTLGLACYYTYSQLCKPRPLPPPVIVVQPVQDPWWWPWPKYLPKPGSPISPPVQNGKPRNDHKKYCSDEQLKCNLSRPLPPGYSCWQCFRRCMLNDGVWPHDRGCNYWSR